MSKYVKIISYLVNKIGVSNMAAFPLGGEKLEKSFLHARKNAIC